MKHSLRTLNLLTVSTLLLSFGCTNIHSSRSLETINSATQARQRISIGDTMEQVKQKMGSPSAITNNNDITSWFYVHLSFDLTKEYRKTVAVQFRGNCVTDVTFSSSEV